MASTSSVSPGQKMMQLPSQSWSSSSLIAGVSKLEDPDAVRNAFPTDPNKLKDLVKDSHL